MTPTERLALSAAFIAAAAVAGLALSLVPNVELVSLVVFCGGVLLGGKIGFQVGAAGMTVYVFANSAVYGYPPSPVPVLAAQALGCGITGVMGSGWRRLERRVGRGWGFRVLPVFGAVAATVNQVLLNAVYAFLFSADDATYLGTFLGGMGFGAVQIGWNVLAFGIAGPPAVLALRRGAKARGWWGAAAVLLLGLAQPAPAGAQIPVPPATADSVRVAPDESAPVDAASPAIPDSLRAAPGDSARAALLDSLRAQGQGPRLRRLDRTPEPLWVLIPNHKEERWGGPTILGAGILPGQEVGRPTMPQVPVTWDRWGLGWGRTRLTYDGFPVNGPVHGWDEPPDMPGAWNAPRREAFTASSTRVDIGAPRSAEDEPLSGFSLTSGGGGRRTTEFALFRNLKRVNVAANLMDREQNSSSLVSNVDATRFGVRLEGAQGVRPRWSLDVSDGFRESTLDDGHAYSQNSRRLQATLGGPTLGGETRIGVQFRRQALKLRNFVPARSEVVWDGYTVLGEWAAPANIMVQARFERDRRRGELPEARTLDGALLTGTWTGELGPADLGAEATLGHQEPWGGQFEAQISAAVGPQDRRLRVAVSREAYLPSILDVLDRPLPEQGLGAYLEQFENAEHPERAVSARVEGEWTSGDLHVLAGGWATGQRGYRIDANPLWATDIGSDFHPLVYPGSDADIFGVYTRLHVPVYAGFYLAGDARVQSRPLDEAFYLARWSTVGDLHWRGLLFKDSLDLDVYGGGFVLGPRQNPNLESYPVVAMARLGFDARVDNGTFSMRMDNPVDVFVESDFRGSDTVTVLPMSGRLLVVALTIELKD